MAVGQVQISGLVQGSPNPQLVLPPYYIPLPNTEPVIDTVALTNGTIAYGILNASAVTMVIFIPPNYAWPTPLSTFTGTLTLKGGSSDTGFGISNVYPTVLTTAGATTTIRITSTAAGTAQMVCL